MRYITLIAGLLLASAPAIAQDAVAEKITYNDHILPLFKQRCGMRGRRVPAHVLVSSDLMCGAMYRPWPMMNASGNT